MFSVVVNLLLLELFFIQGLTPAEGEVDNTTLPYHVAINLPFYSGRPGDENNDGLPDELDPDRNGFRNIIVQEAVESLGNKQAHVEYTINKSSTIEAARAHPPNFLSGYPGVKQTSAKIANNYARTAYPNKRVSPSQNRYYRRNSYPEYTNKDIPPTAVRSTRLRDAYAGDHNIRRPFPHLKRRYSPLGESTDVGTPRLLSLATSSGRSPSEQVSHGYRVQIAHNKPSNQGRYEHSDQPAYNTPSSQVRYEHSFQPAHNTPRHEQRYEVQHQTRRPSHSRDWARSQRRRPSYSPPRRRYNHYRN